MKESGTDYQAHPIETVGDRSETDRTRSSPLLLFNPHTSLSTLTEAVLLNPRVEVSCAVMLPTALSLVDYAGARLGELEALHEYLKEREKEGEEVKAQGGARHLRRRSRSYRKHSCSARKARRSLSVLIKAHDPHAPLTNGPLQRYMESHVWHAKRFAMCVIEGWSVGLHRRDRGCRAAYRSFTQHCVAWDATFEKCVEVRVGGAEFSAGDYELDGVPVAVRPGLTKKSKAWISCDPRASRTVRSALTSYEEVATNRFRIIGPASHHVVEKAVKASNIGVVVARRDENDLEVFAPPGNGRQLWQTLIMAGAHAVGAAERRRIFSVDIGRPSFPDDYIVSGFLARVVSRDKGIPREMDVLLRDERPFGTITTAAFSYKLGKGAGIARLCVDRATFLALRADGDSVGSRTAIINQAGTSFVVLVTPIDHLPLWAP